MNSDLSIISIKENTLTFSGQNIGHNRAKELLEILKTNQHVTHLNLIHNSIGPKGIKALVEILKTNQHVAHLSLAHSFIKTEGAKELAEALKTNQHLIHLNLRLNHIGPEGATALAEALNNNNNNLTDLNLSFNYIGLEGAKALAEALETNHTITHLSLAHNNIGADGAKALAEALKTNHTITYLDLRANCHIGSEEEKQINDLLERNKGYIQEVAKWMCGKFIDNKEEILPLNLLKTYQVCDKKLLKEYVENLNKTDSTIFDKCIKDTDNYIGDNFMEFAGVVKNIETLKKDGASKAASLFVTVELSDYISSFLGKDSLWQIDNNSSDNNSDNSTDLIGDTA